MIFLRKHIILTLAFIFISSISYAGNCIDLITQQLSKGNASAISAYFDDNLSLSLPGNQSTYSHAQAAMILDDFFEKNASRQATIERTGDNAHSKFAIGKLVTSKGAYRLYLVVKESKSDCVIKELRLEK